MERCTNTENLEVTHKCMTGGKGLSNAQVICPECLANIPNHIVSFYQHPIFPPETKHRALERAGFRCECSRKRCKHH